MKVSAVFNTLNEERLLPYALRSVRSWCDEIVVVDMLSTDRTRDIALEFGARVFEHEPLGYADPARAFAVEQASNEWVMMLDADELVPHTLSERLLAIAASFEADIVSIPWKNVVLGEPLKGTGWGLGATRHPRFFRRDAMQIGGTVHGFLVPRQGSRIETLPAEDRFAVLHLAYDSVSDILEKVDRYTTLEAQKEEYAERRVGPFPTSRRALRSFWEHFVARRGYRDGWRGFFVSLALANYRAMIDFKVKVRQEGGELTVQRRQAELAEALLSGYRSTDSCDV